MLIKIMSIYNNYKLQKEVEKACTDMSVAKDLICIELYKQGLL